MHLASALLSLTKHLTIHTRRIHAQMHIAFIDSEFSANKKQITSFYAKKVINQTF